MRISVEVGEKKHGFVLNPRAEEILKTDIIPRIKAGTKELTDAEDQVVLAKLIEELLKANIRQNMEL